MDKKLLAVDRECQPRISSSDPCSHRCIVLENGLPIQKVISAPEIVACYEPDLDIFHTMHFNQWINLKKK